MAGSLAKRRESRAKPKARPRAAKRAKPGAGAAEETTAPPVGQGVSVQLAESKAEAAPRRTPELSRLSAIEAPAQSRRSVSALSAVETAEHETQVVTFQLGKEEYAIDILQVQEIVMMTKITRMPKAPHFIEGIVNLRGQMIPIIDMRKRFSLAEAEHDADTRIIIVDIGEIVGMVVDGVRDVIRLPDSAISPPPPMIQGISAEYLKGIGQFNERLLIMLDLEKVLTAEEQEILRKLGPDGCPLSVDKRAEPKKRGRRDNKQV